MSSPAEESWGGLKPAPRTLKPVVTDRWVAYALIQDHVLTFRDNQTIGFVTEPLPEWFEWVGVFFCSNCGRINIIEGEVDVTEAHPRQMGSEIIWSREEVF